MSALRVRYPDGRGILRDVLREATQRGFTIDDVSTEKVGQVMLPARGETAQAGMVEVTLHVHGRQPVNMLAAALSERADMEAVLARDANAVSE